MRSIPLAEVQPGSVTAAEASAIALALVRYADTHGHGVSALPEFEHLRLCSDGTVKARLVTPRARQTSDVAALARVVSMLLGLETGAMPPGGVPGPLMVTLARALGTIDLPPPSMPQFLNALEPVASGDPHILRRVYTRVAGDTRPIGWLRVPPPATALRWMAHTAAGTAIGIALVLAMIQAGLVPLAGPADEDVPRQSSSNAVAGSVIRPPARDGGVQTDRGPFPIGAGPDAFSPSFSADGSGVLFHIGRRASPLVRASLTRRGTLTDVRRVLADGFANYHPVLSPDGKWLAFDSDRSAVRGVYLVPMTDAGHSHAQSPPIRISGQRRAAVPTWSPDGARLAWVEQDAQRPKASQIWVAELATGRRYQVTRHATGTPWNASWFPDGKRIAYSREDRLVIAPIDQPGHAQVYRSPRAGRLVRTPAVSPDGRLIVFQVFRDGVWVLDVATGQVRRVLDDPTAEEFVWSPRGDSVMYHTRRDGAWTLWLAAIT